MKRWGIHLAGAGASSSIRRSVACLNPVTYSSTELNCSRFILTRLVIALLIIVTLVPLYVSSRSSQHSFAVFLPSSILPGPDCTFQDSANIAFASPASQVNQSCLSSFVASLTFSALISFGFGSIGFSTKYLAKPADLARL